MIREADIERVRAATTALVEEYHLPGIAVGVVRGDDLVLAEGFGHADIESKKPQDPALRQRIGSITKTMTALCAMALVDEGRLSLDARVVDLLPDIPFEGPARALTLRHLLTHPAGIGEVPRAEALDDPNLALWSDTPDARRAAELYAGGIVIEVAPGTKWSYANHGFALLGEIVMRLEDAGIDDVLRRRIFDPLGMAGTDCLDEPHRDLTTGYHRPPTDDARELLERLGRPVEDEETVDGHNIRGKFQWEAGEPMRAAGAVQAGIGDMARYASALLRRGDGIVRPETFATMVTPQWCPDPRLTSIGLSFFIRQRFGHRTFGHGGGVNGGWNTHLTVLPDDGLALLTHCNLTFETFPEVDGRILQALLDAPAVALPGRPVDPHVLRAAPGVYEGPPGRLTNFRLVTGTGRIQIASEDGGLVLRARRGPWKGGVRMLPADDDDPAFFLLEDGAAEPAYVALLRERDGAVHGLRFVLASAIELVRNENIEPWA